MTTSDKPVYVVALEVIRRTYVLKKKHLTQQSNLSATLSAASTGIFYIHHYYERASEVFRRKADKTEHERPWRRFSCLYLCNHSTDLLADNS